MENSIKPTKISDEYLLQNGYKYNLTTFYKEWCIKGFLFLSYNDSKGEFHWYSFLVKDADKIKYGFQLEQFING